MRLVQIGRVQEGMELARDVQSGRPGDLPLVRRGVVLSPHVTKRLREVGVHALWIEDDLGEAVMPAEPLTPEVRMAAQRATAKALDNARIAFENKQPLSPSAVDGIREAATLIARAVADCPDAAIALNDLAVADAYTHRHSLQVATLGLLIYQQILRTEGWIDFMGRRRYDRGEERMVKLGTGLLVHDIGKIVLPSTILNKPGPLDPDEYELVKTHVHAGVSLLPSSTISPLIRVVVRSHHERWDGLGYPDQKAGETVHPFARLAAVADVYDAVTSDRPYKTAAPAHVGVRVIEEGSGTQFDPGMVAHFQRIVLPYPVGHEIVLPDGRRGVVSAVDVEDRYRPTVRVKNGRGQIEEFACQMAAPAAQAAAA